MSGALVDSFYASSTEVNDILLPSVQGDACLHKRAVWGNRLRYTVSCAQVVHVAQHKSIHAIRLAFGMCCSLSGVQASDSTVFAPTDAPGSGRLQVCSKRITARALTLTLMQPFQKQGMPYTAVHDLQAVHAAVAANLPVFVFHPAER